MLLDVSFEANNVTLTTSMLMNGFLWDCVMGGFSYSDAIVLENGIALKITAGENASYYN